MAEQARSALANEEHTRQASALAKVQAGLQERTTKLVARILELPNAEQSFGYEIRLLQTVSGVMSEAEQILASPNTGREAIAAETEVIELLLQSRRINPGGGGGGGANPGGGGGGDTNDAALALLGQGVNDHEVREDRGVQQSTGRSEATLPEEFRAGLDEYFNRFEGPGG